MATELPYVVSDHDCCGEFRRAAFATFKEALTCARDWEKTKMHPHCVCITNYDRADYDSNGLTPEERGQL